MTNTNSPGSDHTTIAGPDPRVSLAAVIAAVDRLIEQTGPDQLGFSTPCPEFTVKDLTEHLIMVLRRIGAIGRGEHWSSVDQEATEDGWLDQYRAAGAEIERVWADPAMLDSHYEVPWGTLPAAPVVLSYVAEIAIHGWDLATSTGQTITVADEVLAPSLGVLQFGLPAAGRDDPEMPFGPVVDPGPDAPMLLQLAGWLGRQVV